MERFYFTYGSEGHPFVGGWSVVRAETFSQAVKIFRAVHPDKDEDEGFVNCAFIYSEEEFSKTTMSEKNSNLGAGCHEVIELQITKGDKDE